MTTKDKPQPECQNRKALPYSSGALGWDLIRLREVWRKARREHDRFSVFRYLGAVFDLVAVWQKENRAIERARRALRLKRRAYGKTIEPFAALIACTSSRKHVDEKARSKWARALIFAAKYKSPDESLERFIRRHGGINQCVAKLSRLSRSS
jgi:xanthine/CO dehydrogenase XdhC/CoxF family maturation factor